jgi:hypothetical protein
VVKDMEASQGVFCEQTDHLQHIGSTKVLWLAKLKHNSCWRISQGIVQIWNIRNKEVILVAKTDIIISFLII